MPCSGKPTAKPAGLSVYKHQRQSDDHRGDRKRKVDQQPKQQRATESSPLEQQRHGDAEDGVQGDRDRDHLDRQPEGMLRIWRGDRLHTGSRPSSKVR